MTEDQTPITPPQSRAGRALIGWSVDRLAEATGIRAQIIEVFESDADAPDHATQRAIRRALEEAGVVFVPEIRGTGAGVRLKFPRQTVKRIETWEGEGGTPGEDDIR